MRWSGNEAGILRALTVPVLTPAIGPLLPSQVYPQYLLLYSTLPRRTSEIEPVRILQGIQELSMLNLALD